MSFNTIVTIWFVLFLIVIGVKAGSKATKLHRKQKHENNNLWIYKKYCPVCGNVMKSDNTCPVCGNIE